MDVIKTDGYLIVMGKKNVKIYEIDDDHQMERKPSVKEKKKNVEKLKLQEKKNVEDQTEPEPQFRQKYKPISSRYAALLQAGAVHDKR